MREKLEKICGGSREGSERERKRQRETWRRTRGEHTETLVLEDGGALEIISRVEENVGGLELGAVGGVELLFEPDGVRGLATELLLNVDASRLRETDEGEER